MFTVIRGDQVPVSTAALPTSQGIRAGEFVFLSAQFSADANGCIVNGSFAEEMRRSFDNVQRVLVDAGLDLSCVVQVRCYLAERGDIPEFNQIYQQIFQTPYPVRTTLVGCLPCDGKIAVDIVAYAGKSSSG